MSEATSGFVTKFSGSKDTFPGGATRDAGAGRGRFDLITPFMLRRLAQVYERGAGNHGDNNWHNGIPFSRCLNSAIRHINDFKLGDRVEDHLAQAIWNLAAVIHFQDTGREAELDDLPKFAEHVSAAAPPAPPGASGSPRATASLETLLQQCQDGLRPRPPRRRFRWWGR